MVTRRKRPNYFILNDGSDDEAPPEDRIQETVESEASEPNSSVNTPAAAEPEILPSESMSQTQVDPILPSWPSSVPRLRSQKRARPAPATAWLWDHFNVTEVNREWIVKRTGKRELTDRDIRCAYIYKTGAQCSWKTSDSQRQTSTSNMKLHLEKLHSIFAPRSQDTSGIQKAQPSIANLLTKKEALSPQELLEKNILRWIIDDKQAFTTIELPSFQQIFQDIPGITLPFRSRSTLKRRLIDSFDTQRQQLKEELAMSCKSIALSVDIWTSKNQLPILGVMGHWLTEDFLYKERVLEFTELQGIHSGENVATAIHTMLSELDLQEKLITITGDNAGNNETMVSELFHGLQDTAVEKDKIQFEGLDSYVRCIAHILNLIVKDILRALKSGNTKEAFAVCDDIQDGKSVPVQSALAKLRILTVWINRSPQRRQSWKEVCKIMNLPGKYIEYDVETRWNSTFRMLDDGLTAKAQIIRFVSFHPELQSFTDNDWSRLSQIHQILAKFNELTLFVSEKRPQISLTVPLYYDLHDLLYESIESQGIFKGLDPDIASAMKEGLKKYEKYYTFMDESEIYYTALVLDPRVKGDLISRELEDKEASDLILEAIRNNLHKKYPPTTSESSRSGPPESTPDLGRSNVESRMLQRLQPLDSSPHVSDIDRYFDTPRVSTVTDTSDPGWLCNWWRLHRDEFPQMAEAARDYLAIPASEVAVERVFNIGRDLLGIRRQSMSGDTLRILMLLDSNISA
jgi:hAT family C-terminal dimerisation region